MTEFVPYEPPINWKFLLDYLRKRQTAGVERIGDNDYSRTIEVEGVAGSITVWDEPLESRLVVSIHGDVSKHAQWIKERVRHMFDLNCKQDEIGKVLDKDPLIGPIRKAYPGIRVPGAWSAFELLVRTVVGQQVSVSAATTIIGRIVQRIGQPAENPLSAETPLKFPSPELIATADLSDIGMPARRVAALQNLASLIATKSIAFPTYGTPIGSDQSNNDIKETLLQLPGIGPWTVSYFALRALRDPDAWPGSDLILRRMLEKHPLAGIQSTRSVSDNWRPFRAYAAVHLWHAYSQGFQVPQNVR